MSKATFSLSPDGGLLSDTDLGVLEKAGTRKRTSLSPGTPKQFFTSSSHPESDPTSDCRRFPLDKHSAWGCQPQGQSYACRLEETQLWLGDSGQSYEAGHRKSAVRD